MNKLELEAREVISIQGNVEVEEDGKLFFESLKKSIKTEIIDNDEKLSSEIDVLKYAEKLSEIDVNEDRILKVTPGRSYSLDVSPETSSIITASGDKEGIIGIWRYDETSTEANLFQHRVHSDSVSSVYFDRKDWTKMYTTSYDGRATIFDAQNMSFNEYYKSDTLLFDVCLPPESSFANSLFLAKRDGCLTQVDVRTSKAIKSHKLHQNKINSVESNPVDSNYLVTASLDRTVGVWDIRKLEKEISLIGHNLAISHAAYSQDGNSIVSLCNDDLIHCFDFSYRTIDENKPEYGTFRHNNKTGRWLSRFKLNFNKRLPSSFVVGSMDKPRCVEVFNISNKKCKRVMRLRSGWVASVQSLNIFHDSLDVLASVNASGKVHIWK